MLFRSGGWGKAENPWDDPSVPYNRITPQEAAQQKIAFNYNTPMTPEAMARALQQEGYTQVNGGWINSNQPTN